MREYKHNTGAIVSVDDQGKKTIFKYGLKFKSFKEIKIFEKECAAVGYDLKRMKPDDVVNTYREYRQK